MERREKRPLPKLKLWHYVLLQIGLITAKPSRNSMSFSRCLRDATRRGQDISAWLRGRVGRLRKSDADCPEGFFASDRQIGDEVKLVTTFLHVSLQPVFCSPRFFHDDHRNRCA